MLGGVAGGRFMGAAFWTYAVAVAGYWQFWVAVAFMLERAAERYSIKFKNWADIYFPPDRRRVLFIWVAIIAFVYANFSAWNNERMAKEDALHRASPRDPLMLYQGGHPVAATRDSIVDSLGGRISFASVTASRPLNFGDIFEFRGFKLTCRGNEGPNMTFGASIQIEYYDFTCRIYGAR